MDLVYIKELMAEEGVRLYVYDDATGEAIVPGYRLQGHPTIGAGRSLDTNGITIAEAWFLLNDDLVGINKALAKFDWWAGLSPVRQFVLVSMAFNVGITGLLAFTAMLAAIFHSDFSLAADEMLRSRWQTQVPVRAHRLSEAMRVGHFPIGEVPSPTSVTAKSPLST